MNASTVRFKLLDLVSSKRINGGQEDRQGGGEEGGE